jgi:hypothetical protein
MKTIYRYVFLSLAIITVGSVGSCSKPDFESFCKAKEACLGGNDLDVDACVEQYEYRRDSRSCPSNYDAWAECYMSANWRCWDVGAGKVWHYTEPYEPADICEAESYAVDQPCE